MTLIYSQHMNFFLVLMIDRWDWSDSKSMSFNVNDDCRPLTVTGMCSAGIMSEVYIKVVT